MKIRLDNKEIDLSSLDQDGLTELRIDLEARRDSAKGTVDRAKRRAAIHAEYADIDWLSDLETKMRLLGKHVQRIQAVQARRKRRRRDRWETLFIDVAREVLDRDTWHLITSEIDKRRGLTSQEKTDA